MVLASLGLTLWLAGPRAADVLAARYDQASRQSPLVNLDQVGFAELPEWLDGELLLAVAKDLSPWLGDSIPSLDEVSARNLRDGLLTVPWVREARVERAFPDQFRLLLTLRRPLLAVFDAEGQPLGLVDDDVRALPFVPCGLPITQLHREGGSGSAVLEPGRPVEEARVRAAVGIALEWRDQLAPLVAGCPQLLEVDATNLGERWLRGPQFPEIRVKLRRNDGAPVTFAYGRPVDSPMPRVAVRTKAQVLANILQKRPALEGLVFADLRLARRWADYLQPRDPGVADPLGPWTDLDRETLRQSPASGRWRRSARGPPRPGCAGSR